MMAARRPRSLRGMLLLEVVLAIAVFVMASIAILSIVRGGVGSLQATRDAVRACDLARSAMARIEAGLDTPQSLTGPVPLWEDDAEAWEADELLGGPGGQGIEFADAPPRPSLWEIEVETEPSSFSGLTEVTVRTLKRSSANSEELTASYTLRQLVRLVSKGEDKAGEPDELSESAARGARSTSPRGGGR